MTKCDFTMTPCPKGCKDANEVIISFRKELEEHVSSECPGREYQCMDCGLKDKYRVIIPFVRLYERLINVQMRPK